MHSVSLHTNQERSNSPSRKDGYIMYRKRTAPLEYDVLLATSIENGLDLDEFISESPFSKVEYTLKGVRHYVVIAPDIKNVIEKEIFAMAHSFLSNPDFELITYVTELIREGLLISICSHKKKKVIKYRQS